MKAQFLVLLVTRAIGSLMMVAMGVLVARWSGPESFGVLSTILATGAVFFVFVDCGFSSYVSKAEAMNRAGDVAAALQLNVATSLVGGVVAVAAILSYTQSHALEATLCLLGIGLALEKNVETALSVPIARGDKITPAASLLVRRSCGLAGLLLLHRQGVEPLAAYTMAFTFAALAGQAHMRLALRRSYASPSARLRIWRESVPFLISNVSAAMRNLDVAAVSSISGSQGGGLYAAAQRLTSPFMLIPGVVASLVLPTAAKGNNRRAWRLLQKLLWIHAALLLLLTSITPLSESLTVAVLGEDFRESGAILGWLLVAFPFVALSSPLGGLLQSQHHERVVAINGLIFAVALVPTLLLAALMAGPAGAAAALAIVYAAKCAILVVLAYRRLT